MAQCVKASKQPASRRHISDEEFRREYYGDPRDPGSMARAADNQGVIKDFANRWRHKLDHDELEDCGMIGMLRAMEYFQPGFQKFTTQLYRYVDYECKTALKRKTRCQPSVDMVPIFDDLEGLPACGDHSSDVDLRLDLEACMKELPPSSQNLIHLRFSQGLSIENVGKANGYGKTKARELINNAANDFQDVWRRKQQAPV